MKKKNIKIQLKYKPVTNWQINISNEKPEIICISGPYIHQLLSKFLKETGEEAYYVSNKAFSWWGQHHHGHGSFHRALIKLRDCSEIRKDHLYTLVNELKYRKEKHGAIVSHNGSYQYFSNDRGLNLLGAFKEGTSIDCLEKICQESGIPEEEGLEFFKKLIIFGIVI